MKNDKYCPFMNDVCIKDTCRLWLDDDCAIVSINFRLTDVAYALAGLSSVASSMQSDWHGQERT